MAKAITPGLAEELRKAWELLERMRQFPYGEHYVEKYLRRYNRDTDEDRAVRLKMYVDWSAGEGPNQ